MAGRILGFLVNLVTFPCVAAAVGYVIFDMITPFINDMNLPMDAINTMLNLKYIFIAGCFLFVLVLVWNHMVQAQNQMDQVS